VPVANQEPDARLKHQRCVGRQPPRFGARISRQCCRSPRRVPSKSAPRDRPRHGSPWAMRSSGRCRFVVAANGPPSVGNRERQGAHASSGLQPGAARLGCGETRARARVRRHGTLVNIRWPACGTAGVKRRRQM